MSPKAIGELGPTYRLQLTPSFGFEAAMGLSSYLRDLQVSYAYLSPVFEAVPGSEHGYDVTDPTAVRRELGGFEGLKALSDSLHGAGLKVLADIVPNHVSTFVGGPWWRDVLRHGRASSYATVFDVSWEGPGVPEEVAGKVVLPILGAPLEEVLARGELSLRTAEGGEAVLAYFDTELPLAPDGPGEGADVQEVVAAQNYVLSFWRDPLRNYRRFFTIDDLVGVRVEDRHVFSLTHSLIAQLLELGLVDALRVDHVDGLADPARYLDDLRALAGDRPIVIEKILTGEERLKQSWPVAGTTGYEVADDITNALADADGVRRLSEAAAADGEREETAVIDEGKRLVVSSSFRSEVDRVSALTGLDRARVERAAVAMPVYRTYVTARGADAVDEALLEGAGGKELSRLATEPPSAAALEGIVRFQQLTSAAMAKGVEDTAWYRLVGKLPFLEVGGDPDAAPVADEDGIAHMHRRAARRTERAEHGLVPGTTHDTKRSADVRARLLALAELAAGFEAGLAEFAERCPPRLLGDDRPPAPGPLERRRIAETCLAMAPHLSAGPAAWEEVAGRVGEALRKGAREAKARDSWEDVNEPYEEALVGAARALLAEEGTLLRGCFGPVVSRVQRFGATLALSQVVLRSFLPGVPDCYQGDESWNLSLVDPDNRRPVDYGRLAGELARLPSPEAVTPALASDLRRSWPDGRVKMLVTRQALAARGMAPGAFRPGAAHLPLALAGLPEHAPASAIAFGRSGDGESAIVLATRAPHRLVATPRDLPVGEAAWADARALLRDGLAGAGSGEWIDLISGTRLSADKGEIPLAEALSALPVAVLIPCRPTG